MKKLYEKPQAEAFVKHPSGLWVAKNGLVFVPATSGHYPHFTFGHQINDNSYLCVKKNGKKYLVHRLVAEMFLPNMDNLEFVNHMDEDKQNNCVSNLEWCDRNYNNNYGTRNERIKKALSKPVAQYSLDEELIKIWPSTAEANRCGFNSCNIVSCCNGKQKTHRGFIWKYA